MITAILVKQQLKCLIKKHQNEFLIFLLSFLIYQTTFHNSGDTIGAKFLTMSIVNEGNFDLNEYSEQLIKESEKEQNIIPYYLIKTKDNKLVSTFGIGVSLLYTPPFWIKSMISTKMNVDNMNRVDHFFKLITSLLISTLLVLMYKILRLRNCDTFTSLLLTFCLGFATNIWSISSTSLWQHGPSQLMLLLTIFFLLKSNKKEFWASLSAIPLSMAVLIRPTNLIIALIFFLYILINKRKQTPLFIILTIPFIFTISLYNYEYFGSIMASGQIEASKAIALEKVGTTNVWSGNLFNGIAGILFSPSRGLFIYSPFLLFLFYRFKTKISASQIDTYIVFSIISILLIQAKWFDWWGGWTFGYRSILDIIPFLIILLSLNFKKIWSHILPRITFCTLIVLSIGIQIIGAYKYDDGWNKEVNVDTNHRSLWSVKNSQLVHYINN